MMNDKALVAAIEDATATSAIDWIIAGLTLLAIGVAVYQLRVGIKESGRTHARDAWLRYLELGVQYPMYGSTALALVKLDIKTVEELFHHGSDESERYWWFLDVMLESMESLLKYFPQKEWSNTIDFNLSLHAPALAFWWDSEAGYYSDELGKRVLQVTSSNNHHPATIGQAIKSSPINQSSSDAVN